MAAEEASGADVAEDLDKEPVAAWEAADAVRMPTRTIKMAPPPKPMAPTQTPSKADTVEGWGPVAAEVSGQAKAEVRA